MNKQIKEILKTWEKEKDKNRKKNEDEEFLMGIIGENRASSRGIMKNLAKDKKEAVRKAFYKFKEKKNKELQSINKMSINLKKKQSK